MSNIDPITLSVIQAGLQQVCDEMDLTFSRSAFSPVIAEADDRSDGIYDADSGELIAQGELGLPVFVGTMQFSTMTLIEFIRDGRALPPEEGDIYIVNDPYLGGTHLMDVRFAMPFYYEGELFSWLSNTGHWPDIGQRCQAGSPPMRPRSNKRAAPAAREIGQARRDGSGDLCDHLFEYSDRRPTDRRYQSADCGSESRGTPANRLT